MSHDDILFRCIILPSIFRWLTTTSNDEKSGRLHLLYDHRQQYMTKRPDGKSTPSATNFIAWKRASDEYKIDEQDSPPTSPHSRWIEWTRCRSVCRSWKKAADICFNLNGAITFASGGMSSSIQSLLRLPCVDPTESNHRSILEAVCRGRHEHLRELLSDGRADPANRRSLALLEAVIRSDPVSVRLLLEDRRADPKDMDGLILRTVINTVRQRGSRHPSAVQCLDLFWLDGRVDTSQLKSAFDLKDKAHLPLAACLDMIRNTETEGMRELQKLLRDRHNDLIVRSKLFFTAACSIGNESLVTILMHDGRTSNDSRSLRHALTRTRGSVGSERDGWVKNVKRILNDPRLGDDIIYIEDDVRDSGVMELIYEYDCIALDKSECIEAE
ncbi:hypothetical protein PROFUN_07454 [Planoprotostelium fungivorum]|uniref:Ankyrin repeat protein n=1 Tax=Planoprotostelium fungivorum TaxID=1890364 RepID=A0A2P6NLF8_9EUKA|nr:hypothetical protein PROFUN_07454 [Planoprotostelium fungivorum]